ncbi:hypothetical protein [Streptomyces sp. NPDC059072]|uniref:hypothetical protein n=1 Tax=Streptomyces sp. NPDC059072 TaxID=3346715 RepID=UPI0036974465
MNKASGPTSGLSSKLVTATCPAGTVLIGGGSRTTPASVGSLKPIASFPTFNDDAHHHGSIAPGDGERNPDSWTAVGGIGGGRGADNATSGGPHLNGRFPSDAAGTPFADGSSDPSYWTASTHSGGSPSQGSYTDVWALCLDVRHGHKQ